MPFVSKQTLTAFAAAVLFVSAFSPLASAAPAPPTPTDPFGDPLPPGVVARLGTLRLRHNCAALAWAPDGRTLASAGWDGAVRIWDAASGKESRRCTMLLKSNLLAIAYLPDGKTIATRANENTLRLWDAATGREVRTLFPAQLNAVALAPGPEEETLLELGADASVHVWDLTTGKETRTLRLSPGKQQTRLVPSADGRRVAGWSLPDDVLTVWDTAAGKELFHTATQMKELASHQTGLAFSRDGKTLAVSGPPGQVVTWDVEAGKELRRYPDAGFLQWLTFTPDGKSLAGLGAGPAIHLWDLASGKEVRKFEPPASFGPSWWGPGGLAFSPDGKTLAASQGSAIHLWDVETGKMLHRFAGHTGAVEDVRFSPDGRRVLTCGRDGTARLWELSLAKEVASWANTHGSPYSMVGLPDGKSVLATSPGGWLRVELNEEKARAVSLSGGAPAPTWVSAFTLSGDGKTLLGGGSDRSVHLWNVETGKEIGPLPIPPKPFGAVAVSPDGKVLAEGGGSAPLLLWDVAAAKELRPVGDAPAPGQFRDTVGLSFSPDGRSLLHVGSGELILYEVATGRDRVRMVRPNGPFGRAPSPEGSLTRALFSPDGLTIAAGTTAGPVVLFDATNGRELTRLAAQPNAVACLAFSADGKQLAAGDVDGTVLVWEVKEWVARPRRAATELKPEKLSALWESLRDADAGQAYKAVVALAAAPKASAPFLKGRMTATDPRVERLIRDLNDDALDVREKAQKELAKLGEDAGPEMRRALEADPPSELRRRLQELLDLHKGLVAAPEEVRRLRAVEALERSGAPESVGVLEDLAKDGPGSVLRREAQAALDRLTRKGAVRDITEPRP